MLVEAAETHAEQTKKRPCPDNGSQCPDLRRRRLSEQTEGNGLTGFYLEIKLTYT